MHVSFLTIRHSPVYVRLTSLPVLPQHLVPFGHCLPVSLIHYLSLPLPQNYDPPSLSPSLLLPPTLSLTVLTFPFLPILLVLPLSLPSLLSSFCPPPLFSESLPPSLTPSLPRHQSCLTIPPPLSCARLDVLRENAEVVSDACDVAHGRWAKLLTVRAQQHAKLTLQEFVDLHSLTSHFITCTEKVRHSAHNEGITS